MLLWHENMGFFTSLILMCLCARVFSSSMPSGHLNPFGCCNPADEKLDEVEGWLNPVKFFEEYVVPNKPIIFRNAAKISPAYRLWTDEYFSRLDLPEDALIVAEDAKKQIGYDSTTLIHFKDWLKQYKVVDKYMIQGIPAYLGKDVILPPSLQCTSFIENAMSVANIMWFSSGGTKALVHIDEFHNINCVFKGTKDFLMIDPVLYGDKVPLNDRAKQMSSLDVDRVDFELYPGLEDVKYHNNKLQAGDCLFVPGGWIHQVNSHDRNIAISHWFRNDAGNLTDMSTCLDQFDPYITLDTIPLRGLNSDEDVLNDIKEFLIDFTHMYDHITYDEFSADGFYDPLRYLTKEGDPEYLDHFKKMFLSIDKNSDFVITAAESEGATDEDWEECAKHLHNFRVSLRVVLKDRPDIFSGIFEFPETTQWEPDVAPTWVSAPEGPSKGTSDTMKEEKTEESGSGKDGGVSDKEEL